MVHSKHEVFNALGVDLNVGCMSYTIHIA